MLTLLIITGITLGVIGYGLWEYANHQKYLKQIPIRIHINGTRGKSSVTRLIGAGLRAGGYRTITKVTGTFPRLILPDGSEAHIHRKEKANILEQLDIIKFCAKEKAEVLLIECMALQPIYQRITEHQMVKATLGVITNIRLDHLDVMGPRLDDVAKALCGTIPRQAQLFTSEDRYLDYMKKQADQQDTEVVYCGPDTVTDAEMEGFTYIEHKENVSLALDLCAQLGVPRNLALQEMKRSIPDEGVLRRFQVKHAQKRIHFYNALAANDPESTIMIWDAILSQAEPEEHFMIVLNTRKDRQDRAVRLVDMMSKLSYGSIGLIGESVEMVVNMCLKKQIPKEKIHPIGIQTTEKQFEQLCELSPEKTTMLAIGNMGAGGAELAAHFEAHHLN